MKKSELTISFLLVPLDYLFLIIAGMAAYFLRLSEPLRELRPVIFDLPFVYFFILLSVVSFFWVIIFALSGLYRIKSAQNLLEEIKQVALASSFGMMAIVIYIFSSAELFGSRFIILAFGFFAVVLVSTGRILARWFQRILAAKYGLGLHKIFFIGNDKLSQRIISEFNNHPGFGYRVIKHFDVLNFEKINSAFSECKPDEILLAIPEDDKNKVIDLIDFCYEKRLIFRFVPSLLQVQTTNVAVDTFANIPFVELKRTKLEGWGKIIKRFFDIFGALFLLIVLTPVFVVLAFIIKWTSRGPVFVKLKRVEWQREFYLIKFRSMIENASLYKDILARLNERSDGPLFKLKNDPRITKIGRVLRKYRLDELPQVWNVLRGEMSLVGPRPHEPEEVSRYQKHHRKVLAIKPGITGMAQVSGSSDLFFEEEVRLDTYYIENWSLWLDIKILLKTVAIVFKDTSAV